MESRVIQIETLRNRETGLLLAISPDMKGLYVHGRNSDEIRERVPIAIRAILEASGVQVIEISPIDEDDAGFEHPGVLTFSAQLAA